MHFVLMHLLLLNCFPAILDFTCVCTSSVQSWLLGDGKEESRVSRRIICVHVRIVGEREK